MTENVFERFWLPRQDDWETKPAYPVEPGRPAPWRGLEPKQKFGYGPYEDMAEHERSLPEIMDERRWKSDPRFVTDLARGGRLNYRDGGRSWNNRTRDRGRLSPWHEFEKFHPPAPTEYDLTKPTPRHWHRKPWQHYNKAADGGRQFPPDAIRSSRPDNYLFPHGAWRDASSPIDPMGSGRGAAKPTYGDVLGIYRDALPSFLNEHFQPKFLDEAKGFLGRFGYAPGGQVKSSPFEGMSDVDLAAMSGRQLAAWMAWVNKFKEKGVPGNVLPGPHSKQDAHRQVIESVTKLGDPTNAIWQKKAAPVVGQVGGEGLTRPQISANKRFQWPREDNQIPPSPLGKPEVPVRVPALTYNADVVPLNAPRPNPFMQGYNEWFSKHFPGSYPGADIVNHPSRRPPPADIAPWPVELGPKIRIPPRPEAEILNPKFGRQSEPGRGPADIIEYPPDPTRAEGGRTNYPIPPSPRHRDFLSQGFKYHGPSNYMEQGLGGAAWQEYRGSSPGLRDGLKGQGFKWRDENDGEGKRRVYESPNERGKELIYEYPDRTFHGFSYQGSARGGRIGYAPGGFVDPMPIAMQPDTMGHYQNEADLARREAARLQQEYEALEAAKNQPPPQTSNVLTNPFSSPAHAPDNAQYWGAQDVPTPPTPKPQFTSDTQRHPLTQYDWWTGELLRDEPNYLSNDPETARGKVQLTDPVPLDERGPFVGGPQAQGRGVFSRGRPMSEVIQPYRGGRYNPEFQTDRSVRMADVEAGKEAFAKKHGALAARDLSLPGWYNRDVGFLEEGDLSEQFKHSIAKLMPDWMVTGPDTPGKLDATNAWLKEQGLPYNVKGSLGIPQKPSPYEGMNPEEREKQLYQSKLHAAGGVYDSITSLPVPPFLTPFALGHLEPFTRSVVKGDFGDMLLIGGGAVGAGGLRLMWPIKNMPSAPFTTKDPTGAWQPHDPYKVRAPMQADTSRYQARIKEGSAHPELSSNRSAEWEVFETPINGGVPKKIAEFNSKTWGAAGTAPWVMLENVKPHGAHQITPEMLKAIQPQVMTPYFQAKGFLGQRHKVSSGISKKSPEYTVDSPMMEYPFNRVDEPRPPGGSIPGWRHQNPYTARGFYPETYRHQRMSTERDPAVRELFDIYRHERGLPSAKPITDATPSSWARMQRLMQNRDWRGRRPPPPEPTPISPLRTDTSPLSPFEQSGVAAAANVYPPRSTAGNISSPSWKQFHDAGQKQGLTAEQMQALWEREMRPRANGGRTYAPFWSGGRAYKDGGRVEGYVPFWARG